jgi:hypothetical protein
MPDITVAADESAATNLIHEAEVTLGTRSSSGSGSLGPFTASWSASAFFSEGTVDLIPPDVIRLADCQLNYSLGFGFSIDLGDFLPEFCLPRICIRIPFIGRVCTPKICVNWPTISLPTIHYSDVVKFSGDFKLNVYLDGSDWKVDIVVDDIPLLQISPAAAAILAAIAAALIPVLLAVPFIGPFLAALVPAIVAAIGIAGVTGLLGPILTPFVSGLTFNVYRQPKLFEVLPASLPLDPAVNVTIDSITAAVIGSDEDELVLTADISP